MTVTDDRVEIRELTARYSRAVDDRRLDDFVATFVPDGSMELVGLPVLRGYEQLRGAADALGYGTVHMTLDPVIDVDGDRATQECTLLLTQRHEDKETVNLVTTGRYADELLRTRDGWRFVHRRVDLDLDITRVYVILTGAPPPVPVETA